MRRNWGHSSCCARISATGSLFALLLALTVPVANADPVVPLAHGAAAPENSSSPGPVGPRGHVGAATAPDVAGVASLSAAPRSVGHSGNVADQPAASAATITGPVGHASR
jgi:hypothetical protein